MHICLPFLSQQLTVSFVLLIPTYTEPPNLTNVTASVCMCIYNIYFGKLDEYVDDVKYVQHILLFGCQPNVCVNPCC
jgi:hypothetical protein